MSKRLWLDLAGVLGLGVSAVAICDMLAKWKLPWMQGLYVAYAVVIFTAIGFIILSKKANAFFVDICRGKTMLLGMRLVISIALFLLGWYINAATSSIYGGDSVQTAYNGVRVFAVSTTMIGHVFYAAFSKKARKS